MTADPHAGNINDVFFVFFRLSDEHGIRAAILKGKENKTCKR